jgi:antitoxin ParD1/3/4
MDKSSLNISLPTAMKEFIESKVASGGYGTASEYIRELVRLAQKLEAKERLEALLLEGLESGNAVEATPEFWQGLRRDLNKRLQKTDPA